MEVTITNENYRGYAEGELPLMIDFWATWCGPCRQMLPIVEELANEYDGKIVVGKCNVDEADDIAMQHGIRSIPTILFIKNGEVVDKSVGAVPKAKLVEKIEKVL
ncbi:MAG: thioredoxin [Prevotella sp.]|nr:thioredoxin [Prevotella sp.]